MRHLISTAILVAGVMGFQAARSQAPSPRAEDAAGQSAAATYEHLATAIIAIEATEDELVKSILIGYHTAAQLHLRAAARGAEGRVAHAEAAAAEVTNIANEGDKRIQAVRQRLSKAGHTHNTDADPKEDYMFINSKEKKALVELAKRVGQLGEGAKVDEIKAVADELSNQFDRAIAPE